MLIHKLSISRSFNPSCLEVWGHRHKGGLKDCGANKQKAETLTGAQMFKYVPMPLFPQVKKITPTLKNHCWERMPYRNPRSAVAAAALLRLSGE